MRDKPDYTLVQKEGRGKLRNGRWLMMRHYDSNQRTLIRRLETDLGRVKQ